MTVHVTLAEAARQLAELVARVGEGEEVLIDEGGRTVARLGPAVMGEPHWRPGHPIDLARHPRGWGVLAHLGPIETDLLASDPDLAEVVARSRIFPDLDQ